MNIYNITKGQFRSVIAFGVSLFVVSLEMLDSYSSSQEGVLLMITSTFLTIFYYLGWKNNANKNKQEVHYKNMVEVLDNVIKNK